MGKTDRSPLMGKKVERDPGVRRMHFTENNKRFRMPGSFSAKSAAIAASALTVTAAIIIVSAIGGRNTHVQAADIYIGTESVETLSGGAGRFSEGYSDIGTSVFDDENSTSLENEATAESETITDTPSTNTGRYTVTFTFHSRDSISCSAEEAATVGELAERMGIVFTEADVLNISADTVISGDTVITTDKVTYGTDSVTTDIPYETKYVDDSSMRSGTTKISQYGQNGKSVTEYEVKYVNGVEESRTVTASYVAKNPVTQIVKRGTAVYTPPKQTTAVTTAPKNDNASQSQSQSGGTFVGGDGKTYRYSRYVDVRATVYYSGGYCANGAPADERVIAVDPSVIPLGTKVYITGDYADIGVRTAADTGGSIKGNIIDICVDPSNPLAGNFGFRSMRVYILE